MGYRFRLVLFTIATAMILSACSAGKSMTTEEVIIVENKTTVIEEEAVVIAERIAAQAGESGITCSKIYDEKNKCRYSNNNYIFSYEKIY